MTRKPRERRNLKLVEKHSEHVKLGMTGKESASLRKLIRGAHNAQRRSGVLNERFVKNVDVIEQSLEGATRDLRRACIEQNITFPSLSLAGVSNDGITAPTIAQAGHYLPCTAN